MPLVSVVIPCYNQASFLKETIESVLKSTYPKIEIIIVNDGSTDHSLQVALKAASTNQQIDVIDQENSGVAAARNNGIQKAKGELILPLDGDDRSKTLVTTALKFMSSFFGNGILAKVLNDEAIPLKAST